MRPSPTSCSTTVAVNVLVALPIRNLPPGGIGFLVPLSAIPARATDRVRVPGDVTSADTPTTPVSRIASTRRWSGSAWCGSAAAGGPPDVARRSAARPVRTSSRGRRLRNTCMRDPISALARGTSPPGFEGGAHPTGKRGPAHPACPRRREALSSGPPRGLTRRRETELASRPRTNRPGQPPWPALPIGPTSTGEPEPSVTGSESLPGQARVTDFVSFGGVTTSPVMRTPEPPDSLSG